MSPHGYRGSRNSAVTVKDLASDLDREFGRIRYLNKQGGFLWDMSSGLMHVDPGGLAVLGVGPEAYDGRMTSLVSRLMPGELASLWLLVRRAISGDNAFGGYFRVKDGEGKVSWTFIQGIVLHGGSGCERRVAGLIRGVRDDVRRFEQRTGLESEWDLMRRLVDVTASALSRALTVEDVITVLTNEEILGSLGAAGISVSLLEQGRLRRFADIDVLPCFTDAHEYVRIDDHLPWSVVFRHQDPLFITREEARLHYPKVWKYAQHTDLTFGAWLPLVVQAEVIGVLGLGYRNKEHCPPQERALLLALASTVAQAVKRAALYDREHATAVALQKAMLPTLAPEVDEVHIAARYRPARNGARVGGDWYDAFSLPGERVGLVVGDVQGHDIQAAALMGQVRTVLRYAAEGNDPDRLMVRVSSFLRDLDADRFATCLYAELHPSTGYARIVRAGHHGPLVRHSDGSTSRLAVAGGLPLGLPFDSDPSYPVSEFWLGPAETLLFCTDGLFEFYAKDIDAGMHRVQQLLGSRTGSTEQLADWIISPLDEGAHQEDDVALLMVTRK